MGTTYYSETGTVVYSFFVDDVANALYFLTNVLSGLIIEEMAFSNIMLKRATSTANTF